MLLLHPLPPFELEASERSPLVPAFNGIPDGLAVDTLDAGAALVLGFRRRCFACRYSTHTVPATTHRTRWSGHRREHSCARSLRPLLLPLPLPLPGLKL